MRRLLGPLAVVLAVLAAAAPAAHAQADPNAGPGGPILVVTGSDGFGRFYPEILRAEGMNEFAVANVAALDPAALSGYQVVVLASTALDPSQAAMFADWVSAGGNLIAMRPDADLAGLLGLGGDGGDLPNGYLGVDPAGLGAGVTSSTMQYHGTADLWTLAGATPVATLYANASAATASPAVTVRAVGAAGGQAAAFTYDLARSVVYTRQGNPAWTGDRNGDGVPRSNDLFFGTAQTDWLDPAKVAIPQADEQQRLLANLITRMNADRTPLPRFWYLPRNLPAAVVMTGDDHGDGGGDATGTNIQFGAFANASPPGCSVADWQCVRGTSYVYPGTPVANAAGLQQQGFEVALHLFSGCSASDDDELEDAWTAQLGTFGSAFPGVVPRTNRTHCIAWNGYTNDARIERAHGIRLDTNYYYWPGTWMQAPGETFPQPGLFTGSGLPMRFANADGSLVDVYQATTQITDEWGLPKQAAVGVATAIDALLARAVGPEGYYAVVTANMHTDGPPVAPHPGAAQIVAAAQAYGVPVVSAAQMLDWLDGRNSSAFQNVRAANGTVEFSVLADGRARGLTGMLPLDGLGGALSSLTVNGAPVATANRVVKGVAYATFPAAGGAYVARYGAAPATPSTTPKKRDRTKPRVTLKRRTVRANRKGRVTLRVKCPRTEIRCRIDLRLQAKGKRIARSRFVVKGGKTQATTLKLSRKLRRKLARGKSVELVARIIARDAAGNRRTTSTRVRVLPPRRR